MVLGVKGLSCAGVPVFVYKKECARHKAGYLKTWVEHSGLGRIWGTGVVGV